MKYLLLVLCNLFFLTYLLAVPTFFVSAQTQDSINSKTLTISYAIDAKSLSARNKGISATYDGGIKTIFVQGNNVRIRQTTLMRIQSIFILPNYGTKSLPFTILKESGTNKYRFSLNKKEWDIYNSKYDSCVFVATTDTLDVLGYNCTKGILKLTDGRELTVYYTKAITNSRFANAEPAFRTVPGIVLKYSYAAELGTITYTAESISTKEIDSAVFKIPSKGYIRKKYIPGQPPQVIEGYLDDNDEMEEDATEDDTEDDTDVKKEGNTKEGF